MDDTMLPTPHNNIDIPVDHPVAAPAEEIAEEGEVRGGDVIMGVESSENDSEGDNHGDVEMTDVGLSLNQLDIRAQRAIFSFNRIDLRLPPLPLEFGKWNDRPLKEKRAKELLATMRAQNIKPFQQNTMIPLIMSQLDVDPSCLHLDLGTVSEAPMLKLTDQGKLMEVIWAAGGRHRFEAVRMATKELMDEIRKMKEMIEALEGKELDEERARANRDKRVEEIRLGVREREDSLPATSTWGVILYDAAKMIDNGGELALHVSRNEEIKHFPEDDREKLVMHVLTLKSKLRDNADPEDLARWLKKLGTESKKSVLGQLFNHEETRRYLLTLNEFEPHFSYQTVYSMSWVKANLHSVGGGVLCCIVEYLANIWRTLLSPEPMDQAMPLDAYNAHILREEEPSRDVVRAGKVGWSSLVDPAVVAKRKPCYDILTPDIMQRLVEITNEMDLKELLMRNEDLYVGYLDMVNPFLEAEIMSTSSDNEEVRNVRATFDAKWSFLSVDHGSIHYQHPLPLLTPAVVEGLGDLLARFADAHCEFWSWIDPIGQYFAFNLKNANEAKDISAWGMRSIIANSGHLFDRPREAARDVAHFVLDHADTFIQLQADMQRFKIPKRPLTREQQTPTALEKQFPGLTKRTKEVVAKMKKVKNTQPMGDWVLDYRGHYDWRDDQMRNFNRDFERFARIADIEKRFTAQYRKDLLAKSSSAAYLRAGIQGVLSIYSKPRQILESSSKSKIVKDYVFPDGLGNGRTVAKPAVDIPALLATHQRDKLQKHNRDAVDNLLRRIENAPYSVARPGTTLLAPAVAQKIDELREAVLHNIDVLAAMEQEENIKLVDPLDEKWENMAYTLMPSRNKPVWTDTCPEAIETEKILDGLRVKKSKASTKSLKPKAKKGPAKKARAQVVSPELSSEASDDDDDDDTDPPPRSTKKSKKTRKGKSKASPPSSSDELPPSSHAEASSSVKRPHPTGGNDPSSPRYQRHKKALRRQSPVHSRADDEIDDLDKEQDLDEEKPKHRQLRSRSRRGN